MATSTTNISLTKPAQTDETNIVDDFNDNMDLIDAAFEDVLAFDTSPVLRGNLDIGAFSIEGVDATEFGYLNGISSFGGTLIDDANSGAARTTLGLVIGTNVQAYDAALTSISGLAYVSASFIKLTANDTYAVRTLAQTLTDIGGAASGANSDITLLTGLSDDGIPLAKVANAASDGANTDITSLTGINLIDLDTINFADATELTIATGEITITQSYHKIDTEADAATDDLTTINGGTAGDRIYICAANDARTVVLKHDDTAGAGKIVTSEDADFELDTDNKLVALMYDSSDSHWHMQAVSHSTYLHLTDTPAAYDDGKYAKSTASGVVWDTPTGAGETNTASNIGFVDNDTTAKIYKQKTGVDLELRTLKEGTAIDFTWVYGATLKISNTSYDNSDYVFDIHWHGQWWLAGSSYTIGIIQALLFRLGTGNTVTLYLYNADADGKPTGAELGHIAVNCTAITTDTAGEYVDFDLSSSSISITSGNKYCFYLTGTEDSTTNCSKFNFNGSSTVADSSRIYSDDSGSTWTVHATSERAFKIYSAASYYDYVQIGVVPGDIGGLLSTTTVAFNADADTTLYTVPTGKRCILSHAIVVAAADVGATTTVSIGQNTAETDFIPANTLSNLDAQYDAVILQPIPNTTPLKTKSYAAATVIEAQVANQSGAAGNTIYLYGTLY